MILDEKIFEGLYYKYSDRLYNFAFRFVSDEHTAQDIVHEPTALFGRNSKERKATHGRLFCSGLYGTGQ